MSAIRGYLIAIANSQSRSEADAIMHDFIANARKDFASMENAWNRRRNELSRRKMAVIVPLHATAKQQETSV